MVRPPITLQVSVAASPICFRSRLFNRGDVALSLVEVHAESVRQLRIARVVDQVGQRLCDLLLHVQSLLQIADVKGPKIFNVR